VGDNRYDRNRSAMRVGAQRHTRPGQPGRRHPGGRHGMPVWLVAILDLLFLGVALNAFALANSTFTPAVTGEDLPKPIAPITQSPPPSPSPTPLTTASGDVSTNPTETPAPTVAVDQGMWGAKFPDKFTDGSVDSGDDHYISKDINIKMTKYMENGYEWCIAEIFIRNKDNFQAFFSTGKFKWGAIASTLDQATVRNAILAISGDNTANRGNPLGYELRNGGQLELDKPWQDIFVMYNDGSMKAFDKASFETEISSIRATGGSNGGVWQIWTFGPMLLDAGGQPMTKFAPDSITKAGNERTAIGYCEPGHYYFMTAGSSDPEARVGPSLAELSQKMYNLGCVAAYNMDGGQSSAMVFNGKLVNNPYHGGRSISDIVGIFETGQ
jgi:hypothetical protein